MWAGLAMAAFAAALVLSVPAVERWVEWRDSRGDDLMALSDAVSGPSDLETCEAILALTEGRAA